MPDRYAVRLWRFAGTGGNIRPGLDNAVKGASIDFQIAFNRERRGSERMPRAFPSIVTKSNISGTARRARGCSIFFISTDRRHFVEEHFSIIV
jgi:hypothetical protein